MNIESFKSGQGVAAIESRIQQIETMLKQVRQKNAVTLSTSANATYETSPTSANTHPFSNTLASLQTVSQSTAAAPQLPSLNALSGTKPFADTIQALSSQYGVDAKLIQAVVKQESGFNPNAVSSSGAVGLMQLMPGTASALGVANPNDPTQNLDGGIRYLKQLLSQFNGNIPLALAAYNAGPSAVTKHSGIPPFPETQRYVKAILADYLKRRA